MFIKISYNTRHFTKCDNNFKQLMLIYIQTSTVQINLPRAGCILGLFYLLAYTCVLNFNSLTYEADKSFITYNAYQSYTCGTEIDISACLPEAFSDGYMYMYCNLMGTIKMYMLFCFALFLLSWF